MAKYISLRYVSRMIRILNIHLCVMALFLSACSSDRSGGMSYVFDRYVLQNNSVETSKVLMDRVETQQQKAAQGELPEPVTIPDQYQDFRV